MTSFALENRYDRTSGAVSFFYNWGRHRINDENPDSRLATASPAWTSRWMNLQAIWISVHTSVTPDKEKQESFVLWNLRASYRLCSFADIFVKDENLLAQHYEINAGFPMPKATVMGGVNINF